MFSWPQMIENTKKWFRCSLAPSSGGTSQRPLTCLKSSLLEKLAVRKLLLNPVLLVLAPGAGWLLRGRGTERGGHLFATQRFPLTLLRHLQSELVVRAIVARPDVSVSDYSA